MSEKNIKKTISTRSLVTMALFAAILSISAYISFPIPVPGNPNITMLNFIIILIALLFPASESFLTIFVWMLLGAVGLPVFIGGKAGIAYLLNPWGGYTISFLAAGVILPLIRGKKYHRIRYTAAAFAGIILIDFLGMLDLMIQNQYSLSTAFYTGFVPFLPLDILKAIAAAQIVPAFKRIMPRED